jgi:hypothetical protein
VGGIRAIVAVIVAVDSPVGRVPQAINDLAAHLPPPEKPGACPLCSTHSWPCALFDDAARRVEAAGLRLGDLVPLDLHNRLWPPRRSPSSTALARHVREGVATMDAPAPYDRILVNDSWMKTLSGNGNCSTRIRFPWPGGTAARIGVRP